ncbi:unnamed protein product [Miscanthus lutarioriparius]|uniref:Uncharacterized protein n=1 Tax=Miscanthus lutarioriparius TaxID=422564 RepID=A0A811S8T5_9POAL|nr:unnamed protein product [Miscanthus lutarioriparius]
MPIGSEAPVDPTAARWECEWPADATSLTSSERADWALSTTEKISVHADGNGTASPLPPGPRQTCYRFSEFLIAICSSGVGKSWLLLQFTYKRFNPCTTSARCNTSDWSQAR